MVLEHEIYIELYHCAKLDAIRGGPYHLTNITERLGSYEWAELDGPHLEV